LFDVVTTGLDPVVHGLDPVVHADSPNTLRRSMDCRIKSGNDEGVLSRSASTPRHYETFASPQQGEGVRKRDGIAITDLKYVHYSRNLIRSR
jgi:hypothetical protein